MGLAVSTAGHLRLVKEAFFRHNPVRGFERGGLRGGEPRGARSDSPRRHSAEKRPQERVKKMKQKFVRAPPEPRSIHSDTTTAP
jgi:hypothetical protein